MNWQGRNISRFLISLFICLFLISCQCGVKSYETDKILGFEKDIYKQAIYKAYLWLDRHPANFEEDGALAILEEIIAFYVLRNNTEDIAQKKDYFNEIQKRVNLIALKKDFKVQPEEYTVFLTVTRIAERLGIHTAELKKITEEQLISDPFLYSQHITSNIWIIVYLERLGYDTPMDLERMIHQSVIQQELGKRSLFMLVSGPVNPIYVNPMTITAYYITHEIFSLTDFGELPPPSIIVNNQAFFSKLFDNTIQWAMAIEHVDLLAEFIMCAKMLDLKDIPSLKQGIEFILSKQEDNGTFGITNPSLPNIYRHGVLVSMMALGIV